MWWWWRTALAEPLALDAALDEAIARNLELRSARAALGLSEQALVRARSAFDPTLTVGVDTAATNQPNNDQFVGQDVLRTSSTGWSASLSQALPTGATLTASWWEQASSSNALDVIEADTVSDAATLALSQPLLRGAWRAGLADLTAARAAADDGELAWRTAVEQAMLDASDAYWGLVSARTSLDLAVRSREIAETSLAETRERYDEGFAGVGDLHQVERSLGAARQAEVSALTELDLAQTRLKRVLGRPALDGEALEPVDVPAVPDAVPELDAVLALAREGNAQWLRDRIAYDQARLMVRQTRNAALPDVGVFASIGSSGLGASANEARRQAIGGRFNAWTVGADVSVPLPGGAARADLASAGHLASSAEAELQAAEQDLVLRVQAAVLQAERDRQRVSLAADTVRFARLALEADQELLREGKGSTRDVVQSLDALDQETAAELAARIDLQRSLLELKRVAGTLVAR